MKDFFEEYKGYIIAIGVMALLCLAIIFFPRGSSETDLRKQTRTNTEYPVINPNLDGEQSEEEYAESFKKIILKVQGSDYTLNIEEIVPEKEEVVFVDSDGNEIRRPINTDAIPTRILTTRYENPKDLKELEAILKEAINDKELTLKNIGSSKKPFLLVDAPKIVTGPITKDDNKFVIKGLFLRKYCNDTSTSSYQQTPLLQAACSNEGYRETYPDVNPK